MREKPRSIKVTLSLILLTSWVIAGCGAAGGEGKTGGGAPTEVTVAYQPGIGSAHLLVMKEKQLLDQQFPQTKINWRRLSSGAAIRDAVIAGEVDIGSVGITPFLTGWNRGLDWKIICNTQLMPMWLMSSDESVQSVADFESGDRIAVPSPNSTNAVYIKYALEKAGLDPNTLDNNFVAMSHPKALQALAGGSVEAHMASPPFMFQEREDGMHSVFRGGELMGGLATVTVEAAKSSFYEKHPNFVKGWYRAAGKANDLINEAPAEAAPAVAKGIGESAAVEDVEKWLNELHQIGETYTLETERVLLTARLMEKYGGISRTPESLTDITFPTLHESTEGGNE